jgi:hypothetical protein
MRVLSWQRFDVGPRLILCSGPTLICVFSLAEFPEASGWWMLGIGTASIVLMLSTPAVGIIATRNAVWLIAAPFWGVRVKIGDIASVTSADVRPMEDFGGWGVKGRSRRGGLLLAADGQSAVRIARPNGQVFLATSDDADGVASAIGRVVARRS